MGLSYFERARIAERAADQGVYPDARAAVAALFHAASPAKRSKILSFVPVVAALDGALRFPAALTERLGLAVARRLDEDPSFALALRDALLATPAAEAEAERATIEAALERAPEVPESPIARVAAQPSPATPAPKPKAVTDQVGSYAQVTRHGDGTLTIHWRDSDPDRREALLRALATLG